MFHQIYSLTWLAQCLEDNPSLTPGQPLPLLLARLWRLLCREQEQAAELIFQQSCSLKHPGKGPRRPRAIAWARRQAFGSQEEYLTLICLLHCTAEHVLFAALECHQGGSARDCKEGFCLSLPDASGFVWKAEQVTMTLQLFHYSSGGSLSIGNPVLIPHLASAV